MHKQLGIIADELKQVEGDMISPQMDPSSAIHYKVQLFEDNT